MEKFGKPDIWADNADGGEALRNREASAAARGNGDYRIRTEGMAGIDPATPTPEQVIAAEEIMGETKLELAPDFMTTKPDMRDTDPNSINLGQAEMIEEIRGNHEGDNAQLVGADRKLTKVETSIPLSELDFNTQTNYIPPIQTTKTPEVKPWHKPAPKESFFKRLFGG